MTKILSAAGVPKDVLELIGPIIDTCRICREWVKPEPRAQASVHISGKHNERVECDLLFHGKHVIFHMVDVCTRWHAAKLVPNKEAVTLCMAIDEIWLKFFGPMQELVVDGEGALSSENATAWFDHHGIQRKPRAPNQHAPHIERRGALFRDQLKRTDGQLQKEGLSHDFTMVVAESVFAGNCMISVGNATPYQAIFGCTPPVVTTT